MLYTIVGKGKTGLQVIQLLPKNKILNIFSRIIVLNFFKICNSVCILFIDSFYLSKIIYNLVKLKSFVVCGTTGFEWNSNLRFCIKKNFTSWVVSNNFSLGMLPLNKVLKNLNKLNILKKFNCYLKEVHHTKKVDSPSGTVISWKNWVGKAGLDIKTERRPNIIGKHFLKIENAFERIVISHIALNRKTFSTGAIWAASIIYKKNLYGLYNFFNWC